MIKPINTHLLIEPEIHESFISTQKDTYDEIGVVLDYDMENITYPTNLIGKRIYFDSWLAAKFPKPDKKGFYWLVKWEDVRAIENNEQK